MTHTRYNAKIQREKLAKWAQDWIDDDPDLGIFMQIQSRS